MSDECRCGNAGTVFLAFVMGAAIGGGVALLTAPRSGKETRDKIGEMADDVSQRVREIAAEAEARIKEVVEEGRETLKEKSGQVKAAVEAGKEAFAAERAKQEPQA